MPRIYRFGSWNPLIQHDVYFKENDYRIGTFLINIDIKRTEVNQAI